MMSKEGRKLNAGDKAVTDFNGGGLTLVTITERIDDTRSQSGICYRVSPPLKGGDERSQYDADWFDPC